MCPYAVKLKRNSKRNVGCLRYFTELGLQNSRWLSRMFYIHPPFIFALYTKLAKGTCTSYAQHSFTFFLPSTSHAVISPKFLMARSYSKADQATLKHTLSSWDNPLYNNQSLMIQLAFMAWNYQLQQYYRNIYFRLKCPTAAVQTRWHQQAIWKLIYTRNCDFKLTSVVFG